MQIDQFLLRDILISECKNLGSQKQFATKHKLSTAFISDAINGRRAITMKLASILGFDRHIVYVTKPKKWHKP